VACGSTVRSRLVGVTQQGYVATVVIQQRLLVSRLLSEGSPTTYMNRQFCFDSESYYLGRESQETEGSDESGSEAVISQCSETVIEPIFVYCEIQSVV
jgi:hypothetical protein